MQIKRANIECMDTPSHDNRDVKSRNNNLSASHSDSSSTDIFFSGMQPSGHMHLGNYLGAVKRWVNYQEHVGAEDSFFFMIADLHAMTVPYDPEKLKEGTIDLAAWFLASGLDPEKVTVFIQSENPDHAYGAWVLSCAAPMGWLERMTQYKEKSTEQAERSSVGLFTYPVLQAADILLYNTTEVPVGEDQVQHVELARDLAKRFNNTFGDTFVVPDYSIQKTTSRIMNLQDPLKKMSKSDKSQSGVLRLSDSPDDIAQKIRRAVTDSGDVIKSSPDKPALTNLIALYTELSGMTPDEIEQEYEGRSYAEFKSGLADVVVGALEPIQRRHDELIANSDYLMAVLENGLSKAHAVSSSKLSEIRRKVGLA